jgi:hypothetical protein
LISHFGREISDFSFYFICWCLLFAGFAGFAGFAVCCLLGLMGLLG